MPVQQQDELNQSQDKLDSTLNGATRSSEPRPDDSARTYGKAGWCYIGEDNNSNGDFYLFFLVSYSFLICF